MPETKAKNMKPIMEIITICGDPFEWESEITYLTERMTCSGKYCVLTPVIPFIKHPPVGGMFTASDIGHLVDAQRMKINLSSAILVMDKNSVVDEVTQCDVDYAKMQGKKIMLYSQEIHNWR